MQRSDITFGHITTWVMNSDTAGKEMSRKFHVPVRVTQKRAYVEVSHAQPFCSTPEELVNRPIFFTRAKNKTDTFDTESLHPNMVLDVAPAKTQLHTEFPVDMLMLMRRAFSFAHGFEGRHCQQHSCQHVYRILDQSEVNDVRLLPESWDQVPLNAALAVMFLRIHSGVGAMADKLVEAALEFQYSFMRDLLDTPLLWYSSNRDMLSNPALPGRIVFCEKLSLMGQGILIDDDSVYGYFPSVLPDMYPDYLVGISKRKHHNDVLEVASLATNELHNFLFVCEAQQGTETEHIALDRVRLSLLMLVALKQATRMYRGSCFDLVVYGLLHHGSTVQLYEMTWLAGEGGAAAHRRHLGDFNISQPVELMRCSVALVQIAVRLNQIAAKLVQLVTAAETNVGEEDPPAFGPVPFSEAHEYEQSASASPTRCDAFDAKDCAEILAGLSAIRTKLLRQSDECAVYDVHYADGTSFIVKLCSLQEAANHAFACTIADDGVVPVEASEDNMKRVGILKMPRLQPIEEATFTSIMSVIVAAIPVLRVLNALAVRGLVHGDVTADNIYLAGNQMCLSDWRTLATEGSPREFVTDPFVADPQDPILRHVDDIFGLGITLFRRVQLLLHPEVQRMLHEQSEVPHLDLLCRMYVLFVSPSNLAGQA